ncbi:unnamed protein product [Brachionus calyciflorus]|uniref:Uncharacterized protein n=1 Tax=Brachionus calyciflorus TaxID=104777 RepID=A0A814N7J8_9BILA|nr:unnamed protein product [Brachionus calyciflorus]
MSTIEKRPVFGDPTCYVTLNILFGYDENKDLAISLINNLLNFHGEEQVNEITFLTKDLPNVFNEGRSSTIIDMSCITCKGEEIIVEFKWYYYDFRFPRTKYYTAKAMLQRLNILSNTKYDEKLKKTYLLIISRENLFKNLHKIDDDIYYEKTAMPIIKELNLEIPGNLMVWKFYEIGKFSKIFADGKVKLINNRLPIKEQWLDFFDKCRSATEIPDNVDDIIKKAYRQMEINKWSEQLEMIYDMPPPKESFSLNDIKLRILEAEQKGEILAEITIIKDLIDVGFDDEMIIKRLRFLTHPKFKDEIFENLKYIRGHFNESGRSIFEKLGLERFFE